jgi:hypothetical protein
MEALVSAVSDLFAAILGRLGHVGRARGRANIREDLVLLAELQKISTFGPESEASKNLENHIKTEVARYSGADPPKKRPWGSIALAVFIGAPLAAFGFSLGLWWALLPWAGAALMLVVIIQMLANEQQE